MSSVIPNAAVAPVARLHQDPRLFARLAMNNAKANVRRLSQSRKNYQGVVDLYGGKK